MIYTCPMHPEIRSGKAGDCPKCGMALEPFAAAGEGEKTQELQMMNLRFWISLFLSLPLFFIHMGDMLISLSPWLGGRNIGWVGAFLSTPVVVWGGWPFFVKGVKSLSHFNFNMFTLIALGTGAAYLFSLIALIFPDALPASFKTGTQGPLYFEAAAVITTLVLLGQVLELKARSRTSHAIQSLLRLTPQIASRVNDQGDEEKVSLHDVKVGDLLQVRPGEQVPVDGVIVTGLSFVNESMVTGEPLAIEKKPGSKIIGGTMNQNSSFIMQAERVGDKTLLARITKLVTNAGRSRAPIQRFADVIAQWFVPLVILTAVLAFLIWLWLGPAPAFAYALTVAVSVLIVACPCALGLATPISIMMGIGRGAQEGILIRNAEALQTLERMDTLVIDKTGTLTEGRPRVTAIKTQDNFTEDEILKLAASLEKFSEHPLAAAIVQAAQERNLGFHNVKEFHSSPGKGVEGKIGGKAILVGQLKWLKERKCEGEALPEQAKTLQEQAQTIVMVGQGDKIIGLISVTDPIKHSSFEAVQLLKAEGMRLIMLTGDQVGSAQAVGRALGIGEIQAEMLPEKKYAFIKRLQKEGRIVAMAGDGMNDAAALAQADIGIAMGTGTDIAMESAPVTLVKGDLRAIAKALKLSRRTMTNIRQNLFFAFFYNMLGVPIAAGILYPFFGILLSPVVASAAMSLSSVSVISNALRLKNMKL